MAHGLLTAYPQLADSLGIPEEKALVSYFLLTRFVLGQPDVKCGVNCINMHVGGIIHCWQKIKIKVKFSVITKFGVKCSVQ